MYENILLLIKELPWNNGMMSLIRIPTFRIERSLNLKKD